MSAVVAVIPARGGSKGIPRKNIVDVAGKPLIAYSIIQAKASNKIKNVFVSTEDKEIAAIAKAYGAEVIDRPPELAEDQTLDLPVFEHALKIIEKNSGSLPEMVVHLRPTAPFRRPGWIDEAIARLSDRPDADSIRSVSLAVQHPYRMFEIGSEGILAPLMASRHPTPYLLRRQDLPPIYYYNCVIDVTKPATIFKKKSMTGDRILPFILEADEVFDIDSKRDLEWTDYFMRKNS